METARNFIESAFSGTSPSRIFSGQADSELDDELMGILQNVYGEIIYHLVNLPPGEFVKPAIRFDWSMGMDEVLAQELDEIWTQKQFPRWRKDHAYEILIVRLNHSIVEACGHLFSDEKIDV